jgi:hypothetical protein
MFDPLIDEELFFLASMVALRLNFSRYEPSDLASTFNIFDFSSPICRENDSRCNICPGCYVFDNSDSYSPLSGDIDQVVRLHFFYITLVLVLLLMLVDYFNRYVRSHIITIANQIKIIGVFLFGCLQKSSIKYVIEKSNSLKA